MAWNDNFQQTWPRLQEKYDTRFKRMWEYYLLSCAGAFRARNIQLWQTVMTMAEIATPQPRCRDTFDDGMREDAEMELFPGCRSAGRFKGDVRVGCVWSSTPLAKAYHP